MSFYIKFAAASAAAAIQHMQNQKIPQLAQDAVTAVLGSKAWPGESVAIIDATGHIPNNDGDWPGLQVSVTMLQLASAEPVAVVPLPAGHDDVSSLERENEPLPEPAAPIPVEGVPQDAALPDAPRPGDQLAPEGEELADAQADYESHAPAPEEVELAPEPPTPVADDMPEGFAPTPDAESILEG